VALYDPRWAHTLLYPWIQYSVENGQFGADDGRLYARRIPWVPLTRAFGGLALIGAALRKFLLDLCFLILLCCLNTAVYKTLDEEAV
jgi:hypothetical protein